MLKTIRLNAKDFYILYKHFYQKNKSVSRALLVKMVKSEYFSDIEDNAPLESDMSAISDFRKAVLKTAFFCSAFWKQKR